MRDTVRPVRCPLLLAILCATVLTATLRADEPPKPPAGEARVGAGRVVNYTVHFDRNSLRDSVRLGDGLVALTSAGTLLRFEFPAVRLVRERVEAVDVTCLGRGDGDSVLAGLSDGRICRVQPDTLELTDLAKVPAPPRWIGWGKAHAGRPAGLVVVTRPTKPVDHDGRHWDVPYSVVHDLATGKAFALEDEATTFLLDRASRVWLGADRGEWGGRVTRVDLIQGTTDVIKPPPSTQPNLRAFWHGIYGFVELRDGQVWAFGGSSHMGLNRANITRVDLAEPRALFFAFKPPREADDEPEPGRPTFPITHVLEEGGKLLVLSYSDLFRTDQALGTWEKVATLRITYRWGRRDAVGAYPSVCAVHPPRRPGEPIALATVADGYVLVEGAKTTPRGLAGQIGAANVDRAENTSEGMLFFESDERLPVWRLGPKGWEVASLTPPVEPDPDGDAPEFEARDRSWYETRVLVGADGTVYTVSGTAVSPGTRTTARRAGGKSERLGRESSSLYPSASFLTADGTLWNAAFGVLRRFENGRWQEVAEVPKDASELRSMSRTGPPWLLLDRYQRGLWRLEHGPRGQDPRLSRVEASDGGTSLRIHDAIPWTGGTLLLATDAGLRAYAPATQTISRVDLPEPPKPATSLARDGLGRLWLGGEDGLWLGEPGAKSLESLAPVPGVGRGRVDGVTPDPQRADGIIVALGRRGVAFVQAPERR